MHLRIVTLDLATLGGFSRILGGVVHSTAKIQSILVVPVPPCMTKSMTVGLSVEVWVVHCRPVLQKAVMCQAAAQPLKI